MRKLLGLQYLRGLAAIAVAVFHATGRGGASFHVGEAGVDLFFLLSGFLMIAITGPETRPLPFLADRIRRIVPVYWAGTTVMLVAGLAGAFPNLIVDIRHVVASYLFVPWRSPNGGHAWPLLVPGWTLNYEMFFYLIFALLLPFGDQRRQVIALTVLFGLLAASPLFVRVPGPIGYTYTDPMLLEFVAGCWLGLLWKRPGVWPRWLGRGSAIVALMAFAVTANFVPPLHRAIGFGIPATLLLASVLALERREAIGRHRLALFLGDASYSIYIWHGFGISAGAAIAGHFGLPPALVILLALAGGLAAGIGGYLAIERPVLAFFRERRFVRGVPVPGGP